MASKLSPALAKRLASYSATAGVTLAIAPAAEAQVVYHDLDPDLVVEGALPPDTLDIDLDDDGVADLQLVACGYYDGYVCPAIYRGARGPRREFPAAYGYDRVFALRALGENGVLGRYFYYYGNYDMGCASRLSTGAVIGAAGPGQGFYPYAAAASYTYFSGGGGCYSFNGEEGYAGFRFVASEGALHYGWIRLSATEDASMGTAYEYAYESAPETPIVAGAIADAALSGEINQASFPPEGGTLQYTFTVENITTEPLPLDLWVDHSREGGGGSGRTRLLGSGTLAPRACVTRTVALPVPAGAPAGTYDVRFKVGDFDAGQFLTFERFAVTKEAPTGVVEGGAEPFVAAPVVGDLFAFADAAGAIAGTHVLTGPAPNPTAGQVAFGLAVDEAQHVTVAAYDALGRRVALLYDGLLAAGAEHQLVFDGEGLPDGVYVVRAVGEAFADTRVFTLAR